MQTYVIQMNHEIKEAEINNPTHARADLLARCVNAALWLDKDIRRDIMVYFVFDNITISFDPTKIKQVRPDERNIVSYLKHTLDGRKFPGIVTSKQTIEQIIDNRKTYVLDIEGKDIRETELEDDLVFVLGDDLGLKEEVKGEKIKVSPKSLLTSHCITIINNELDRRTL